MAVQSVRAQINGTWYTFTYNSSIGKYQSVNAHAPGQTSYNLTGGYYPVIAEATNTAGTTTTVTTSDPTVGDSLKLVVKERIAPVITIASPTNGAYVSNNQQPIVFTVVDEQGGSGINSASITVKVDNTVVSNVTKTAITNGFSCTATPSTMTDGSHTITIDASDNDGNAATQKSVTITVDTVPPTLNITSPTDGLITAEAALTVQGMTNDSTSSPVTIAITLNGTSQGSVTVNADGSFTKSITLAEGNNTIAITATDKAGKTTTINRSVVLDTTSPQILSVSISPNPADAGASITITVEVV